MTAPVLSLRNVRRTYVTGAGRDLTVLKGVDLDVRPGEIVGLIGPSGSGKSSPAPCRGAARASDRRAMSR